MIDDFTQRRRAAEQRRSAIHGAPPAVYRVHVSKGSRARLYRIDPVYNGFRCEVWNRSAIHRTQTVPTATHMHALKKQYVLEVAELLLDGWTLSE